MRKVASHGSLTGLFLACAIGFIAASPFFVAQGLPAHTDAELHVYRIAELAESLAKGNLYPRWAPDFYHGFGYPIFNYYGSATYHAAHLLMWIFSASALGSAKIILVGTLVLGTVGGFLLGRFYGGEGGGLLGATCLAFAPYMVLINPHIRGDYAEVVALSLLPWVLWSWELLWVGDRRGLCLAVPLSAIVLFAHNLTGLILLALLLFHGAWQWLVAKRTQLFAQALVTGLIVVLVTAYFWLPFLAESGAVKLEVAGQGHYDFRQHFVAVRDLSRNLPALDWGAAAYDVTLSAGTGQLLLVGLGAVATLVNPQRRWQVVYYLVAAALSLWLTTESSAVVWDYVPGLYFFQFPWRFLGPFAVVSIPVIASVVPAVEQVLPSRLKCLLPLTLAGTVGALILASAPAFYLRPWESLSDAIDPQSIIARELMGRWRGTTSTDDFVPKTVQVIPEAQETLVASYAAGPVPDRVNRYTLPEGASVEVLPSVPWRNTLIVRTPVKFVLRLYLFDFPGWRAWIDGERVDIERANPEGFVTMEVPPGQHMVEVGFKDTPVRAVAWGVSAVGALAFGWLVARRSHPQTSSVEGPQIAAISARSEVFAAVAGALLLVGLVVVFIGPRVTWFRYSSPPGTALRVPRPLSADFGGEIRLLGYGIENYRQASGRKLEVEVYWNATQPITQTYQSFVHLVDDNGNLIAQSDHLNPAGFPTDLWPTDRYVLDRHVLVLPDDARPGEYRIAMGLYLLDTKARLTVRNGSGEAVADQIIVDYQLPMH